MPIDLQGRPIGVTLLSLIAFAVSPVFVILLLRILYAILTEGTGPSPTKDIGAFLWLCFWLTLVTACLLTLAWITFTAGLDLWRLKDRGRKLAYISVIPFVPLGTGFLLSSDIRYKTLGAAFCVYGGFFLIYLRKPTIQQKLAPPPDMPH